jgi:beta-lactamase superfamily II metal-dependent hydrolase
MLFTLEAVQALHGDALLLHFGQTSAPELMVIDGGPSTVYDNHLRPRLLELKKSRAGDKALPVRAIMISHIDDDHINGILSLLRDLDQQRTRGPLPFRIDDFWFNSFDDLVGKEAQTVAVPSKRARSDGEGLRTAAVGSPVPPDADLSHTAGLVVASVTQGRDVRDLVKTLGIPANKAFGTKPIMLSSQPKPKIAPLTITVVAPSKARKDDLNVKWDKVLVKKGLAKTAAYVDTSVENLSSIVMLVEAGQKSMLLTGDARGDDVLAGLRAVKKIAGKKPLKLDILKLPHHGSIRDTDTDFFELLPAAHYVVSANGKYDNPDLATMQMLSKVRTDDNFTIHLTNHTPWLDKFFESEKKKQRKYKVSYPEDTGGRTIVNLGDELED